MTRIREIKTTFTAGEVSRELLGSGGSAQAVLLGLFDETEDDLAQREQLDNLRNRALDLNTSQNRSLNLLQATQLSQRNKLEDEINGFGRLF